MSGIEPRPEIIKRDPITTNYITYYYNKSHKQVFANLTDYKLLRKSDYKPLLLQPVLAVFDQLTYFKQELSFKKESGGQPAPKRG